MSVVKLNVTYRRPRKVRGKEIWAQSEPPSEMVWEICPYVKHHPNDYHCMQCPAWFEDPTYGTFQRGCYGMAAEVCRIIFAMQVRNNK